MAQTETPSGDVATAQIPPPAAPPSAPHPQPPQTSATARTETFSDGVLAIVITLLTFNFKVPPPDSIPPGAVAAVLPSRLAKLLPQLVAYILSFAIVGTYWVAHHNIFKLVTHTDRLFIWINLAFLMCVAFIPFPTALLGEYVDQPIATTIYGATLIASSIALFFIWHYATTNHRLVDSSLSPSLIAQVKRRMLLAIPVYSAAILLAYLNIWIGIAIFAGMQVLYMLPGHIDKHTKRTSTTSHGASQTTHSQ